MIKIAICDDEKYMVDDISLRIMDYFDNDKEKFELFEFNSGSNFLSFYNEEGKADIIFMDIEVGDDNGIEIISKVREIDENVIVIFVTSHDNYVHKAFRLGAFQYVSKPVDDKLLLEELDRAIRFCKNINSEFILKSNGISFTIRYKDTYSYEMRKGKVYIHIKNKSYLMDERITIGKIEKRVIAYDFIRVEQSHIINMSHISEIGSDCLKLDNDELIPISRKNRVHLLSEYNKFLLRRRV